MKGTRTRDLDVKFLFGSFAPMDVLGVIASLNDDIGATGINFRLVEQDQQAGEWLFASATHCIAVQHNKRPLPPDALREASNSSYTRAMIPDTLDRIAGHRSYVHVTLSSGNLDLMRGKARAAEPTLGDFTTAVNLAVILAMKIMALRVPDLVHWGQSNQLVLPRHLDAACDMATCYPLLIHPLFFSEDRSPGEISSVGFRTLGARDLLGQEIELREVRIPFPVTLELVFVFVGLCEVRGRLLADGETFGDDAKLRVRVRHVGETTEAPRLELTVEHHAAFGIGAPLAVGEKPQNALQNRLAVVQDTHRALPHQRAEPAATVPPKDRGQPRGGVISATREKLTSKVDNQAERQSGLRGLFGRVSGRPN